MKIFITIIFAGIFYSCSVQSEKTDEKKIQKHDNLISFRCEFEMDMDELFDKSDEEYQKLTDDINFNAKTDTILYLNDTLYISYLTYVNACAEYAGNIEFKNDTIILDAYNILDEVCASGELDRFIYTIYNPENIKYKIVKY